MDEDGLFNLVKTKPGKKTSYEVPVLEKKSRKKLKVDATKTSEILNPEKEQLEGDSSKLSQQSSSSPALQTPSASPVFKGLYDGTDTRSSRPLLISG